MASFDDRHSCPDDISHHEDMGNILLWKPALLCDIKSLPRYFMLSSIPAVIVAGVFRYAFRRMIAPRVREVAEGLYHYINVLQYNVY